MSDEMNLIRTTLKQFEGDVEKRVGEKTDAKLLEMQKQLDEIELRSKDRPIGGGNPMNTQGVILKALQSNAEALKNAADRGAPVASIKTDAAAITTGNFGAGVVLGQREPGVNEAPRRRRFLLSIINTMNGGPGSNPLTWVEWRPGNGGPAGVSESGTKPGEDWTYVEAKQSAETIAVTAATTKQALLNLPILAQQINNDLLSDLADELDRQILLGDGSSPTLKGIVEYAKAFTGDSLAGTIDDANIFDVIRAAVLQVRKGNKATTGYTRRTGYVANYALVSPVIAAQMDLIKDDQGRYILPPFRSNDGQMISGVQVVENDFVDDDDFYVGDFTKSLFNFVEGINIQTGWINDQFIKNQLTVRAEVVGVHRIKYHDGWAFVKGDFTSAKALLNATS